MGLDLEKAASTLKNKATDAVKAKATSAVVKASNMGGKEDGQTAQSNATDIVTKAKQEEYKSKHPDWNVNGTYYGTEEEYKTAKEAYEKKVATAKQAAETAAAKKKAQSDSITSEINNAIYGEGADLTLAQMQETVGGVEMASILGNSEEVAKRQHLLDPTQYEKELKKPNNGKMPHNEDPFPVDLKIEEMEVHKPDVKIHEVVTHKHGQAAAMAAMLCSDTAEKRLIHLENNVATLMRYVFRMGARMQINCVYYGGQTPFEKYRAIRCLNHDRVSEGQNVQIDQCLTCTRFEPIFGQCYELMNDLGANVAAILDDNQMAYTDMEEYVNMDRIEKFIKPMKDGEIDLTKVLTKNDVTDPIFREGGLVAWGKGLAMNWEPVPKEDQRCHINWRQSINDDGTNLQRLASFPKDTEVGPSVAGAGAGTMTNKIELNYQAMEKGSRGCESWISKGKGAASNPDTKATDLMNGKLDAIKKACNGKGVDSLLVACIMEITNKTADSIVSEYTTLKSQVGDNPATICSAMSCGVEAILGKDKIPGLWTYGGGSDGASSKPTEDKKDGNDSAKDKADENKAGEK